MRRWRGQSGPGADGRRRYRGYRGEKDALPTRKLVISRAPRDADKETTYFLAPRGSQVNVQCEKHLEVLPRQREQLGGGARHPAISVN